MPFVSAQSEVENLPANYGGKRWRRWLDEVNAMWDIREAHCVRQTDCSRLSDAAGGSDPLKKELVIPAVYEPPVTQFASDWQGSGTNRWLKRSDDARLQHGPSYTDWAADTAKMRQDFLRSLCVPANLLEVAQ